MPFQMTCTFLKLGRRASCVCIIHEHGRVRLVYVWFLFLKRAAMHALPPPPFVSFGSPLMSAYLVEHRR